MDEGIDATVATGELARAAVRADRLVPSRSLSSAGIQLSAAANQLRLLASDGEVAVRGELAAAVAAGGGVVVSRRALAATLATITAPEVRLRREGARLAIRTPSARYALPLLELSPAAVTPPKAGTVPEAVESEIAVSGVAAPGAAMPAVPPVAGWVEASHLKVAGLAIAGAASRDGLPIFTGVRVRGIPDGYEGGPGISLVATDRFRMASVTLRWLSHKSGAADGLGSGAAEVLGSGTGDVFGSGIGVPRPGTVDVLVPAGVFAEAVRQVPATGAVPVRSAEGSIGFDWADGGIVAASLALPFPDEQIEALMRVSPVCSVQVEADALTAAVQRAVPFAGASGHVHLEALDGFVVVSGADADKGESREEVKADVGGDHVVAAYQGRYLADALRPFAGRVVRVLIQEGIRPTLFAAAEPDPIRLRCLVVPLRKR